MKTMPVGELKARFSEVLQAVKKGEEVVVSYGRRKENIAVILPYARYKPRGAVRLGMIEGKATFELAPDFAMTTEELVQS